MTTSEEESESFDESDEEVGIRGRLWNRKGHGIGDYENFHNVPGEPSPIGESSSSVWGKDADGGE